MRDTSDSLFDFFYSVGHNRVQGATNMMLEAFHWIKAHQPYWCAELRRALLLCSAPRRAVPHGSGVALAAAWLCECVCVCACC